MPSTPTTNHPQKPILYLPPPDASCKHFVGRANERQALREFYDDPTKNCLVLWALGGQGKTTLARTSILQDVLGKPLPWATTLPQQPTNPFTAILFWRCDEQQTFDDVLQHTNQHLGNPQRNNPQEQLNDLLTTIREQRILLVIDRCETLQHVTKNNTTPISVRAIADLRARQFVHAILEQPTRGRLVLITRYRITDTEHHPAATTIELGPLHRNDADALLTHYQLTAPPTVRDAIIKRCAGLPAALTIAAGIAKQLTNANTTLSSSQHYDIATLLTTHHGPILDLALKHLPPPAITVLSILATSREPLDKNDLTQHCHLNDTTATTGIISLQDWLLLSTNAPFTMHDLVREGAYQALNDPTIHETFVAYYEQRLKQPNNAAFSDRVEHYYHLCRSGRRDDAITVFLKDLQYTLHRQNAHYHRMIELLRELFTDNNATLPAITDPDLQAKALFSLAAAHTRAGEPTAAIPLLKAHNDLVGHTKYGARGIGALAMNHLHLGHLTEANNLLTERLQIARSHEERYDEAIALQELGLVAMYHQPRPVAAEYLSLAMTLCEQPERDPQRYDERWEHVGFVTAAYRAQLAFFHDDHNPALLAAAVVWADRSRIAQGKDYDVRNDLRLSWLAGLAALADHRAKDAVVAFAGGLGLARRHSDLEFESWLLVGLSRAHLGDGNGSLGLLLAHEALVLGSWCGYRLVVADAHLLIADGLLRQGDRFGAVEHARAALALAGADSSIDCLFRVRAVALSLLNRVDLQGIPAAPAPAGGVGSLDALRSLPAASPVAAAVVPAGGVFAMMYSHDCPQGKPISQKDVLAWRNERRHDVDVFIWHERASDAFKGEVYFRRDGCSKLDDSVPRQQYVILRHLLRSQSSRAQRELPAIIEACWPSSQVSHVIKAVLLDGSTPKGFSYRTSVTKLSVILRDRIGARLLTKKAGSYVFDPPLTFCLIERHPESDRNP